MHVYNLGIRYKDKLGHDIDGNRIFRFLFASFILLFGAVNFAYGQQSNSPNSTDIAKSKISSDIEQQQRRL